MKRPRRISVPDGFARRPAVAYAAAVVAEYLDTCELLALVAMLKHNARIRRG